MGWDIRDIREEKKYNEKKKRAYIELISLMFGYSLFSKDNGLINYGELFFYVFQMR